MSPPLRRVLMTADAVGGVFSYAVDLSRLLCARGIEVVLAIMGPAASHEQRARASAIHGLVWLERPYRLEWMAEPWDDVDAAGAWLLELEARHAPDLVHLNGFAHGALPFVAPKLVVGHSCVLSWWWAVKGEPAPEAFSEYAARVRQGLAGADLVAAPSRAMLDALALHYGPLGASRVLYNGHDAERFAPARKKPQIAAAGRLWDEAKNLSVLEALADQLAWPIYLAGEAQAPGGGAPLPESESTRLLRLGQLSRAELAKLLSESAVFVSPARYEPFGLTILEAAASGCALVLADIPSLRELWSQAAIFVPPNDTAALAAALQLLTHDAALRNTLAHAALERARSFSPQRFIESTLQAYQTLRLARSEPLGASPSP